MYWESALLQFCPSPLLINLLRQGFALAQDDLELTLWPLKLTLNLKKFCLSLHILRVST